MTDDELAVVRELFAADDHPLDDATAARLLDRLDAELAMAANERNRSSTTPPSRRRHRLVPDAGAVAIGVLAVLVAVLLLPISGSPPPGVHARVRHHLTPTTNPGTQAPHFVVAGYTTNQAQRATAQCLDAASAMGQTDAALRATFTDTLGSLLVVTTPTGFYTCNESPAGTFTSSRPFETYEAVDGSPPPMPGSPVTPTAVPGDPGAHWLLHPAELDQAGGGYQSKSQTNVWVTTAIGRVAPDVARVAIQLPGEPAVNATVENGFFVARQVLSGPPAASQGPVTVPLSAYSRSGALVFDSLTAPTAIVRRVTGTRSLPTPPCSVTPSGQPVTPASDGQHCQTAIAWGY